MLPAFFFVYIIFLLCFFRVAAVVRVYRGRRTVCMTAVVRACVGRGTGMHQLPKGYNKCGNTQE